MVNTMRSAPGSARFSHPVRIGDVLTAAVPALEERLLVERMRRGWRAAVGAEIARRTRPAELKAGTLTITVDNSPWLQELSMRSAEVLDTVRARFGPTVTALRLTLGGPAPAAERPAAPRPGPSATAPSLDADEAAVVERAVEPVHDRDLATTVRRIVAKGLLARRGRGLAALAVGGATLAASHAGCATARTTQTGPQ